MNQHPQQPDPAIKMFLTEILQSAAADRAVAAHLKRLGSDADRAVAAHLKRLSDARGENSDNSAGTGEDHDPRNDEDDEDTYENCGGAMKEEFLEDTEADRFRFLMVYWEDVCNWIEQELPNFTLGLNNLRYEGDSEYKPTASELDNGEASGMGAVRRNASLLADLITIKGELKRQIDQMIEHNPELGNS